MKICAYVQASYAKSSYKNECMDQRQFAGLRVIIDCLARAGYAVEYATRATVHEYDVALVSITSDCDWWPFIQERLAWQRSDCKVLVGGAGVLHVEPFLPWFYAAMLGRGENLIVPLVQAIARGDRYQHESILYADEFSRERVWRLAQVEHPYCHIVHLSDDKQFAEGAIGCNHRCLFCGYTWQRKFASPYADYRMEDSLFGDIADKERAMLDLDKNPDCINWSKLRTTAIDGFSERLRFGVNKRISRSIMQNFFRAMLTSDAAPHQLKLYNICGYPSETESDWFEFLDELRSADQGRPHQDKQWSIVLHCTPFRAMPATPMACAPMSKRNYRGVFGETLGPDLRGNLIYQGNALWSVEGMGVDSLATVMLSALAHRGAASDSEYIAKLCSSRKFWTASALIKENTLARFFDMDKLFGAFTPQTLPSRYLRTYANIEKMWGQTPLELAARKGGDAT